MAESRPTELPIAGERPRERRDAAANRDRILAAARRLLTERAVGDVSMDAVAAASGVGKGTLFRHFSSRAGLMGAVIDDHMREFQDAFISGRPPLGPGAPAPERLEAFLIELVRLQLDDINLMVAAEADPGGPPSALFGALLLHTAILLREIDPEIDGELVGAMILSAVSPPLLYRMHIHLEVQPEAIEKAVRRLLRGIVTAGPD
jgi:AcrR family transcriptional regulator